MTDLKNAPDEAAMRARLEQAAEHAVETLRRTATDLCEEIAQASRALAAMPMRSTELLAAAAWAASAEIDIGATHYMHATVNAQGTPYQIGPNHEIRPSLPAGRYRALVFLVPLDGEKR